MSSTKRNARHIGKIIGFNLGILATLYLLWCAIPIGIDPTPSLQNKSDLQEQDRAEIVAWLKRKNVIYGVNGKSHIYWPSFWKPWTRNQYRCWVLIEPKGAGYRVYGEKQDPNGSVEGDYFVSRGKKGWEFDIRGHPMKKY